MIPLGYEYKPPYPIKYHCYKTADGKGWASIDDADGFVALILPRLPGANGCYDWGRINNRVALLAEALLSDRWCKMPTREMIVKFTEEVLANKDSGTDLEISRLEVASWILRYLRDKRDGKS